MNAVLNYKKLIANIPTVIDVSGYRKDYIARKLGISPQSFSAKMSRKSFSVEDVERLMKIIKNDDIDEYFMLQEMREQKNEENISYEDAKNELGWN